MEVAVGEIREIRAFRKLSIASISKKANHTKTLIMRSKHLISGGTRDREGKWGGNGAQIHAFGTSRLFEQPEVLGSRPFNFFWGG